MSTIVIAATLAILLAAGPSSAREVTLYVIDDFSRGDSHGANVRSMLERASARRVDIRSEDVGKTLDRDRYFQALRDIEQSVRSRPSSAAVVNLSFGSYEADPREAALLDSLRASGVIIVAAAGNDGTDRTFYPSGYASVLAVGALDDEGRIAAYSNVGSHVQLFAPGHYRDEVVSNYLVLRSAASYEHIFAYRFIGGTSFAVPQVAGLLAYLLAEREDLTPDAAVDIVLSHARVLPVRPGRPPAKMLDARSALAAEDPLFRRVLKARLFIYGAVGVFFLVSLVYARGAGVVLLLGTFLWGGLMWIASRLVVGRFGLVNGTMLLHSVSSFGVLLLSSWNLLAAIHDRQRERLEREVAERIAAAIAAAAGPPAPEGDESSPGPPS